MTIYTYTDGNIIYASEQNQNLNEALTKRGLSLIRTLQDRTVIYSKAKDDIWGEAYTAAAGRMGSVNTTQTNATFSTNKYIPFVGSYYFIIEATSLTEANFAINNCLCKNIATGKWIFYSTSSTLTQKKADMIKTLFYGTTGTDERIESTYITGLTALKSNLASDVGKRVYRVTAAWSYAPPNTGGFIGYWRGTYSNTTTNTDVNAWGSVTNQLNVMVGWTGSGLSTGWAVNPLSDVGVGNSVSSDNPATVELSFYNDGSDGLGARGGSGTGIVFTKGTITWARAQNQDFAINGFTSTTDYDYTAVGGIPLITLATETELNTITHNIPAGTFASNVSTAIGIPLIVDWETGANFQFKLKNTSVVIVEQTITPISPNASNATATLPRGLVIDESIAGTRIKGITKHASCSATRAVILNASNTVIDNALFSGNIATFSSPVEIDDNYKVCVDSNGASYNSYYYTSGTSGFPYVGTGLQFTFGWDGAANQYAVYNITSVITDYITTPDFEDSGWLDASLSPAIQTFTPFTSEPTTLLVKIVQKDTSPTAGYPSLSGFAIRTT